MNIDLRSIMIKLWRLGTASGLGLLLGVPLIASAVTLADQPVFSTSSAPGNLALALSVEYPTAVRTAHVGNYSSANTYLGYFDPNKCYLYRVDATPNGTNKADGTSSGDKSYFYPDGLATNRTCTGANVSEWSGNFLNWAATPTIDPFRWAMTGGRRVVDTPTETILEKAWSSGQGGLFPDRAVTTAEIAGATPYNTATAMTVSIDNRGYKMRVTVVGGLPAIADFTVRVKVCDPSAAAGGVEANCKAYGANYKPEGLIQKYSQKIRFSAFGYLNDSSDQRDGGVMRARQKFVGPTAPVPGQLPVTNAQTEWSDTTGVMTPNPDAADATDTNTNFAIPVTASGVMNYLNQFGQLIPGNYKSYDPVSEMYYAVVRYYKNQGNVSTWSSMTGANAATRVQWADGFPVITNWGDPVQYSCQRNFILGIGDINTHVDKNVAGNTTYRTREPAMPPEIVADGTVNAITATNKVGALQGVGNIGSTNDYSGRNNSAYIAGLAYDSHFKDIRPDVVGQANTIGLQTIETFWVDVLETPFYANNQFYLAAKYGGLKADKLPAGFDPYTFSGTIPLEWWSTNGETLTSGGTTQSRPDNYYAAGKPDTMVSGLTEAFNRISNALAAFTTSFSLSTAQVSALGAASYAAQYDSKDWSGEVTGNNLVVAADGSAVASSVVWSSTTKLATQFAGTGWDTGRRIATWNGTMGVAFRIGNLGTAQAAALDTAYTASDDRANYLNYLRGERTNERTDADTTKPYRQRGKLLGDIVGAKVTPVGGPAMSYSASANPGYAAFKTAKSTRPTMVYAAANDGMLHAFVGGLTDANSGTEQFAYVPSGTYLGPSSPATPQMDGLAQLGSPNYVHHYYVDATPSVFDIDFNYAGGTLTTNSTGSNARWRSVLIGGLGKGGKSFYAIDVTDPGTMTSEATVASKVLWEFTDPTMGFSFGAPVVAKTKRYGWVVVLSSGYNNSDGRGYLYFVNPETGALLQKVSTGTASNGLTHVAGYFQDYSDNTVDAFYAGDLDGQLWRFDVTSTAATPYPAPTKLATLTSGTSGGVAQPITTQPLIEIQPSTSKRYVMVGTGQLLDASDINSSASQSFYAILDGTATAFRPADATMPVTRSQLTALTDLTVGVTLSNTSRGWYLDLGSTGGVGWRTVIGAAAYNGVVSFASLLTTPDACSPSGTGRVYAIDFDTGKTVLTAGIYASYDSAVIDAKFVSVDGVVRLLSGRARGEKDRNPLSWTSNPNVRLLNWREVPTVD